MSRPRDRCVPTLLNQPVNKLIFCPHTRRLVCSEFRQVCDKIGACRALSISKRIVGPCRLVCGGPRRFVGARAYLNQLPRDSREQASFFQHGGYRLGPRPKRGKGLIAGPVSRAASVCRDDFQAGITWGEPARLMAER